MFVWEVHSLKETILKLINYKIILIFNDKINYYN